MNANISDKQKPSSIDSDRKRRKREVILIGIIIVIVSLLAFAESRIIHFGTDFPVSNTVLMFILINVNLLLAILLIYLVFRNIVKLLYDRKRKVMGAKLRTRLVVAFISLTLLPTVILFLFSINFITTSMEFWFKVPVEQSLEKSLSVGRSIYTRIENDNRFFLERIAYQIKAKSLLSPDKGKALSNYIQVVQSAFNFDAVEVYSANSKRLMLALSPKLGKESFKEVSADDLIKKIIPKRSWSITEKIIQGELVKTIGTIPFGSKPDDTLAFVVVTTMIPPDLSLNMKLISKGFEEYQQIKLMKKPIQITYYISLSIVAFLVLFCAIWFGFYMAKSISIPIKELAEGARRVAEGELGFSIDPVADDEIGSLVEAFNKMTKDLRIGREQLELSALMLQQQNVENEERRQYMEIVLENISAGVVTLDSRGYVTTANKSAEKMLNLKSEDILKKSYKNLLGGQPLQLIEEVMEDITNSKKNSVELPLRLAIEGRSRSFLINANALKDDTGNHVGIVMVFDDLTELEKGQRMAAWREVARRIAHEVKNPLTPIALSAQRLKRKYSEQVNAPVFNECIRMIIDNSDLIRNLVNEFSSFARFPSADPKRCELPPIIEETLALYKEGYQKITFKTNIPNKFPNLSLDRQQIKQAMINLVDNAIAAIKNEGSIIISLAHDSILKKVRLEIADNGVGISDEDKTRLFEPNFSTKKAGMGLGLTIVNSIIADHGGMISARDNIPHGAKFVIELPV